MHDERTQRIAVRRDNNALAFAHFRRDLVFKIRNGSCNRVFEALAERKLRPVLVSVLRLIGGVALIGGLEHGRTYIERTTPDENLLLAELLGGLGFVQPLKRAVMALVELI